MENLESIIESVVFVAGEPVMISDLCLKFDVKQKQIEKAVENLQQKYNETSGVQLLCLGEIGKYLSKMYLEVKKRTNYIIKEKNVEK